MSAQTAQNGEFPTSSFWQDPESFTHLCGFVKNYARKYHELAQNLNQNNSWSCKGSSIVQQACEHEMTFEHQAPNTLVGGKGEEGKCRALHITTTALGVAKHQGFLLLLVKIK